MRRLPSPCLRRLRALLLTQMGVILGTAAYMSPEQVKGRAADKRSDVWAFGVVLYELLTGRRAFTGDDVSDTLAAVLRQDVDMAALPPRRSAGRAGTLVSRCLDRDVKRRLRDIGEAPHRAGRSVQERARRSSQRPAALPRRRRRGAASFRSRSRSR